MLTNPIIDKLPAQSVSTRSLVQTHNSLQSAAGIATPSLGAMSQPATATKPVFHGFSMYNSGTEGTVPKRLFLSSANGLIKVF